MNPLFIGTYNVRGSAGIYTAKFDGGYLLLTGEAPGRNPSFLALHPNGRFLYAANELPEGGVTAYAVKEEWALSELNSESTGGSSPCHLAVHPGGQWLAVVNYGSGSVLLYPVTAEGHIGGARQVIQHEGSGPDPKRQSGPHAHSVTLDEDGSCAYVCDLGIDRIIVYRLDQDEGRLLRSESVTLHPGAGPRHFTLSPDRRFAYVINELDSTVTVMNRNADTGGLAVRQTVSTLPADFSGPSTCADIHAHPSGRFLYGSNRGHDSIALFSVHGETGEISLSGTFPSGGRKPRSFAIDPSGRFLLAANQDTDNIVIFRLDESTGGLEPTGAALEVPSPVCVKFQLNRTASS